MTKNIESMLLFVENNPYTSLMTQKELSMKNYSVITIGSCETAVYMALRNENIYLVLMDVDINPGLDGITATKQIKEQKPELNVVGFSSNEYLKNSALKSGMSEYHLKPLDYKKIIEIAEKYRNIFFSTK